MGRFPIFSPLALVAGIMAGCSSPAPPKANPAEENLRKIASAYGQAASARKKAPTELNQLLPYLKEHGDPDEILRSTNDHEPFVIVWGVNTSNTFANPQGKTPALNNSGPPPVLAYEKRGVAGVRYVVTTIGSVAHLTDGEFRAAPFPNGHKPE